MIFGCRRHNGHRVNSVPAVDAVITVITDTHLITSLADDEVNGIDGERYYYTVGARLKEFTDYTNYVLPDLAVNLGDAFDGDPDVEVGTLLSETYLGGIDERVQLEMLVGNHETNYTTKDYLAGLYGRGAETAIAGSKFNHSFNLGEYTKIIMLDTAQVAADPYDSAMDSGVCDATSLAWIESELVSAASAGKKRVIIFTHHQPHGYTLDGIFVEADAIALAAVVNGVAAEYPNLNIVSISGHRHPSTLVLSTIFGENFPGYVVPSALQLDGSIMLVVKAYTDGSMNVQQVPFVYPYADIRP